MVDRFHHAKLKTENFSFSLVIKMWKISLHPIQFWRRSRLLLLSSSFTLISSGAIAAEQVVLRYGAFRSSVPVADLAELGSSGQAPASIQPYLRLLNREPVEVQQALTSQISIDHRLMDRVLNSPVGEVVLDRLGDVIQTPTGAANRQALRAALVLAASNDGKVSLLEVIQHYPTQEIHLDGKRLLAAYRELSQLERQARKVERLIKRF